MNYRAYIETAEAGRVRVFPKSKKTATFATVEAARRRLEGLRIAGRGIIWPAERVGDWSAAVTIAL